jgi:transposase
MIYPHPRSPPARVWRQTGGNRDLEAWLKDAEESSSTAMRNFALGLRKDLDALRAGLSQEWSNGCVEGFVHKLKLLKRQGYGRAGFELLRARMLAT